MVFLTLSSWLSSSEPTKHGTELLAKYELYLRTPHPMRKASGASVPWHWVRTHVCFYGMTVDVSTERQSGRLGEGIIRAVDLPEIPMKRNFRRKASRWNGLGEEARLHLAWALERKPYRRTG